MTAADYAQVGQFTQRAEFQLSSKDFKGWLRRARCITGMPKRIRSIERQCH